MKYDYKKTIMKGIKYSTVVLLTGIITMYKDDVRYTAFIPVVMMALNYLKHK